LIIRINKIKNGDGFLGRLLFFAVIFVLIFWILKKLFRKDFDAKNISSSEGEDMVCCDYCNLHLPKEESVIRDNKFFCSEEHARLSS
tara:strand:+ start:27 stop:287 length:261 start_codon:yes stop_codon:yes gene_type:complete